MMTPNEGNKFLREAEGLEDLLERINLLKPAMSSQDYSHLDWSSLPAFGGEEPPDTSEIWSWDKDSILLSDGQGGFVVEPREETCLHGMCQRRST